MRLLWCYILKAALKECTRARAIIPTAKIVWLCLKNFKEVFAILLNGKFISTITEGRGEDILFLHGYLSNKESFYYQIKYLSAFYKVTAPDILGFGKSSPIDRPYSVGDYADWLSDFIKKLRLENAHIIAHSFGARVAFKYLSENPNNKKLVITGGAGLVKERSPRYMRRVKAYRRVKKLFPKFAEKHFGSKEYRTLSPVMKESYKLIVNEDLKSCVSKIGNETLLIYGRDDTVTPPSEEGEVFQSLLKNGKLVLCDGGHFCFSEHPEEFNEEVYKFLSEQ